ncbi:MAG: hypothetical protein ACYC7D_04240 [Nitrososphaerales archaeon]
MRSVSEKHRPSFLIGTIFGLTVVLAKLIIILPVNLADMLYGVTLLTTLIITAGELSGVRIFGLESRMLHLIVGFLFPLDCYAVLILFSIPLPN